MSTASADFEAFTTAVHQAHERLSPQQRLIGRYVLEHPDELALGTVASVAEAAAVQPSALVRFANAMGYAGFRELQQLFQARLLQRAGSYRERIGAMRPQAEPADGVLHQFVLEGVDDLRQLQLCVGRAELDAAADLIRRARRVHVLAQRRAFPVAAYLAYALAQLDLQAQLLTGVGGMLAESLRQIEAGDLLVVASFKNYSPQVLEAAAAAHQQGRDVVAITDHASSPLRGSSRVCFELGQGPSHAFRSLVAPLCLAQALVVRAGQKLLEKPARGAARAAAGRGAARAAAGRGAARGGAR